MPAASSEQRPEFWAAIVLAIGAAGVILTSALYALSPAAAALPVPNPAMPEAFQAAQDGGMMWAAGTIGVISDVVLAAGALVLMTLPSIAGTVLERLGWAAAATTAIVFILVDTLVGYVLPPLASMPGGEIAFVGFKRLFDALFGFGTLAFGTSAILIFGALFARDRSVLGAAGALVGAFGMAAGLAHFGGLAVGQAIGVFVALASILLAILGVRMARRAAGGVLRVATASA